MLRPLKNLNNTPPDSTPGLCSAIREFVFEETLEGGVLQTSGTSMLPTLRPGSTVRIIPLSGRLRIGRCYVFYYNNKLCCHRLVKKSRDRAWFIGDAGVEYEEVNNTAIIGSVPLPENLSKLFFLQCANRLCLYFNKYQIYWHRYNLFIIKKLILTVFQPPGGDPHEKTIL